MIISISLEITNANNKYFRSCETIKKLSRDNFLIEQIYSIEKYGWVYAGIVPSAYNTVSNNIYKIYIDIETNKYKETIWDTKLLSIINEAISNLRNKNINEILGYPYNIQN
jgi:hypothetical protein